METEKLIDEKFIAELYFNFGKLSGAYRWLLDENKRLKDHIIFLEEQAS